LQQLVQIAGKSGQRAAIVEVLQKQIKTFHGVPWVLEKIQKQRVLRRHLRHDGMRHPPGTLGRCCSQNLCSSRRSS
jgi:hypothetical protein